MRFNIDIDTFKSGITATPVIVNIDLSKIDHDEAKGKSPDEVFMEGLDYSNLGEINIDYVLELNSDIFREQIPFKVKMQKYKAFKSPYISETSEFNILFSRELKIEIDNNIKVNFTHELVFTLLQIKPRFNSSIGYSSYLNINSETFWGNEYPVSIDEESGVFDLVLIDESLKIQTGDLHYKYERKIPKSKLILQLVPKDYSKPESKKEKLERELIFQGSFKDCFALFNNDSFIEKGLDNLKTKKDRRERQKQNEESQEYYNKGYKEDYFNAVTDGQLGNYNDFDGDIDYIDTWNRG